MRYNPEDAQQCLPAGRYASVISEVTEKDSKPKADGSTVPMVVITYTIYSDKGNRKITDYTTVPAGLWRLKGLAKAIGQESAFNSGNFDSRDYLGHNLDVELEIESDKGGQYPDKNRVKSWHPSGMKSAARNNGGQHAPPPTKSRQHDPSVGEVGPLEESKIPF